MYINGNNMEYFYNNPDKILVSATKGTFGQISNRKDSCNDFVGFYKNIY